MAVLGRLKIAPNQRLDLPDIVAFDSYSAGDWKGFLGAMVGDKPYLIKGFEVFQPNTLIGNPAGSVDIVVGQSSLWWATGEEGSFFVSLPDAENKSVTLITDATNYIEMTLTLASRAEDARALWDPGANGGAGGEFTQVVDTENYLDVAITRNNTGFSEDKIPIAKIVVNSSNNVIAITDCRPMMFRLGTGGNTPDPLNDYIWEDDPVGYDRTDTPVTMTSPLDPNVFRGADKNIPTFKAWMDAVMSRLKEIDGGSKWFQATGGGAGGTGGALSLTNLFLDSQAGHSPMPDRRVTFAWSKSSDGQFRSENAPSYSAPARWTANFGQLKWQLGGTFVSPSNRAYSSFLFNKAVADGENLYLGLQRDAALNGDPIVHFENLSGVTGFCSAFAAGAFTGVACGDYVRKESNNVYQYYRVAEIRVNAGTPFTNGTVEGTVADATVAYLLLETHDGPITTTDEPYRFFRKSYQSADLVTSSIGSLDTSMYWLGRRFGSMFYFRDYGDMQPGEETEVLNDHDGLSGSQGDIAIEKAHDSVYDSTNGYSLKAGGTTTLVTIRRRLADNTVGAPSNLDNSGSLLEFTINAPVGTMATGSTLWVRLGTTSGGLSGGDVTNVTTDNVWEVRTAADAPLRSYDNRNVFMVASKLVVDGTDCLLFADGSMLSENGQWVNNHLDVTGDLFLRNLTYTRIPYIGANQALAETVELRYDPNGGPDFAGQFRARNFTFGRNASSAFDLISQVAPYDVKLFPSIGEKTITIGGTTTTTYIPGDLIVDGDSSSLNISNLSVDDKVVTLGVGSPNDGAFGAGIEAADNTLSADSIEATIGDIFVDITYSSAHNYALADVIGVDSNTEVGGITAGQINGSYTVVATGSAIGDAEIISATVLRVWTKGTATSNETVSLVPPTTQVRTFESPWSFRIGDSSGGYTGITSWVFRVKGVATTPTLTPVSGYGIVPTASSANMLAGRIGFVNADGSGPGSADTTIDFSPNLNWDNSNDVLLVDGDINPITDNVHSIGSTTNRWSDIHLGPAGAVVHGDATNTLKVSVRYSGSLAIIDTDATSSLQIRTGTNNGIRMNNQGAIGLGSAAIDSLALVTIKDNISFGSGNYGLLVSPYLFSSGNSSGIRVTPIGDAITGGLFHGINIGPLSFVNGGDANQVIGIAIDDQTAIGALRTVGIRSSVTAAAKKWNLFVDGDATNYIQGGVGIGNGDQTAIDGQRLLIGGTSDTTAAGGMLFGGGLSNLYRSAANTLKTDGNFIVGGNATVTGSLTVGSTTIGGSLNLAYASTKTANYALLTSDCVVPFDTTAAGSNVTATLPASTAGNKGQLVIIKDVGGAVNYLNKALVIAPNGTDTIDGINASITMTIPKFSLTFVSDGAGGWILT